MNGAIAKNLRLIWITVGFLFLVIGVSSLGNGFWTKTVAAAGQAGPSTGGGALNFELPNGMNVVLQENHAASVVAMQVWVKVGSTDETPNLAGMAHVHEHMLFKGTKKRGVGQIAREVETSGGDINAWTSFDQTVYHIVLASRFFDAGIDILADAIRNSQFDPEELSRELEVVLEEIRRGNDMPSHRISEEIFSMVFKDHPYGRPVIGYDETVSKFSRQQILNFYKRWYVPNNMTFVLVGDFKAKEAAVKIRKAFAGFTKGKVRRVHKAVESEQRSMRAKVIRQNVQETYFDLAFPIPDLRHEDTPALDLLSMILSHGDSSRLNQRIKEQKGLVNGVSAYAYTPKDPGVFLLRASGHHGKIMEAIRESVKEIALMRYELASTEELRRARTNILSEAIYEKETVEGQARKLGYYQTVYGDLNAEKEYYDQIESVTLEDLRRVAERYFRPEKVSVIALFPEKALTQTKASTLKSAVKDGFRLASKQSKVDLAKGKEVQIFTLKNGIKILVKEDHQIPLLAVRAASLGGLRSETPETNGLSFLVSRVWVKGTPGKSALEIAKTIESFAGSIDAVSGRNSLALNMDVLSQYSDEGFSLFNEILRHPAFEAKELDIERRNTLEAIRNREDNLPSFTFRNFMEALYGSHPYGMDVLGTRDQVSNYSSDDLRNFYERIVKPDNLVISVVGDVQAEHVVEIFRRDLEGWQTSPFQRIQPPKVMPISKAQFRSLSREKEQAHIVFGFQGTTIYSEDRFALEVLNTVLAGQGGRLFLQLRDRQSLAYSITSMAQEGIDPGFFAVYIGTDPRKVPEALDGIRSELDKILTKKVSRQELDRAKKYIVGSFEIDLQRSGAQASNFAYNELYGLGWDNYKKYTQKVMKVTAEEVQRVAGKYLQMERPTVLVVGPDMDKELGWEEIKPKSHAEDSRTAIKDQAAYAN